MGHLYHGYVSHNLRVNPRNFGNQLPQNSRLASTWLGPAWLDLSKDPSYPSLEFSVIDRCPKKIEKTHYLIGIHCKR